MEALFNANRRFDMTATEQTAYNNGFILGMASKGVIYKTAETVGGDVIRRLKVVDKIGLVQYEEVTN